MEGEPTIVPPVICGGTSKESEADEEVQSLVDQLSDHIKSRAGKNYPYLKAISYKTQVVAGRNFFVKVDAGDEHIHLRIFFPLPCYGDKPELSNIQLGKSKHDSVEYF